MNLLVSKKIVALALVEDIGLDDISTNALVPKKQQGSAHIVLKSQGVVCGLNFARLAFKQLDPRLEFTALCQDGNYLNKDTVIARLSGQMRAILTAERVSLNFLTYLSNIATQTHRFVQAIKPYTTPILDTRKTTPLLRILDRYAVRTGGGVNHRFDLSSMVMIKDNHYIFDKNPVTLVETVQKTTQKPIILEVDDLKQLALALTSKADIILLDNMTPLQTKKAVLMRNTINKKILLESSGGITLANVKQYAACGVDRISVGSLTQVRSGIDISLDIN